MNLRKITILLLTILLSLPIAAQKRKRVVKPKPAPVVEEPQEDPRITNMREMTQQIVFVDSIVVNKDQFLASIRLSSECGQLMNTGTFFRNQLQGTLYLNEMGNKVYFSLLLGSLRILCILLFISRALLSASTIPLSSSIHRSI